MKWPFSFFLALLFLTGPCLYADEFAVVPGSSPASVRPLAVSTAAVVAEPFQWPVPAMVGGKRTKVISKFGRRKVPMIPGLDTATVVVPAEEMHEGVDFGVPDATTVRAARSGKVLFAGFSGAYVSRADKKDKNHLVILKHDDGKSTRYVHLNLLKVRPGQVVKAGDVLGTSSESDEWTEPVVHFEIREAAGQAVDPMKYLTETSPGKTP